tara:strand:- start:180 stop:524 length:345 start_codon:yes stop_codon:yes gene_type:complete
MVNIVKMEEFYQSTFGGRPCQLDMSIYVGVTYECGCGSEHSWNPYSTPVIREIPGMKVVIDNPQCGYVTLVKIKLGFLKYKFESIISSINKFDNKTTQTPKKTKKKKKKKKRRK